MIPKLCYGKTKHHGAHRGSGRGRSGGRWGRQMRNGYQLMHNPIRTIRCWNRSNMTRFILQDDEIQFKLLRDSKAVVKYYYPMPFCRCCWSVRK